MDFNAIYKLNEADEMQNAENQNPAPGAQPAQGEQAGEDDGLPQDVHASEEALNIAMNQLQQIVKGFKNDGYILKMMEFYDGKTPKNESINMDGSNEKRLTEAKKGSFTAYYKQLTKSLSNTQKKIKIVALILIATAIVAGAGVGTVLIKKLVSGKKLLGNLGNASDKGEAAGGDASGASSDSSAASTSDTSGASGNANSGGQQANAGNSGANAQGGNTPNEAPQGNTADSSAGQDSQGQAAGDATNSGEASADGTDNAQSEVKPETVLQNLKTADNQIVNDVIKGKYGNYPFRANNLLRAGYNPISVQNAVNQSVAAKSTPGAVANPPKPQEVTQIVQTELDSGKLNVSDDGKVIPETPSADTANTQAADANANTNATASTQNNAQSSVQPATQSTASTTAQSVAQTAAQIAAATRSNGGQAPAQNPTPTTNANAAATAQTAANGNNNAAYENWKKNPKNQKMLNNLSAQARAAGQDPEKAMKDAFDKELLHTVNR